MEILKATVLHMCTHVNIHAVHAYMCLLAHLLRIPRTVRAAEQHHAHPGQTLVCNTTNQRHVTP